MLIIDPNLFFHSPAQPTAQNWFFILHINMSQDSSASLSVVRAQILADQWTLYQSVWAMGILCPTHYYLPGPPPSPNYFQTFLGPCMYMTAVNVISLRFPIVFKVGSRGPCPLGQLVVSNLNFPPKQSRNAAASSLHCTIITRDVFLVKWQNEHFHGMFLEWWNRTKSLSSIWQHFSCLLDEGIPKIWNKLNFHHGFLS